MTSKALASPCWAKRSVSLKQALSGLRSMRKAFGGALEGSGDALKSCLARRPPLRDVVAAFLKVVVVRYGLIAVFIGTT